MKKIIFGTLLGIMLFVGCDTSRQSASQTAASGVKRAKTTVEVGSDGLTVEQRNVKDRLAVDNKPGSIKHLYLVSPFNGRQIFYQTVKGKITSSGKRLTPKTVSPQSTGDQLDYMGMPVTIGEYQHYTSEVLQDDGTYGDSAEYIYFWNENGQYFQLYVGGLAVVISDQPISFQDVVLRQEKPE